MFNLELDPEIRHKAIQHFKERLTFSRKTDVADAEAAYEKSLGIAPSTDSTALNTIDGIEKSTAKNVG